MTGVPDRLRQLFTRICPSKMPAAAKTMAPLQVHLGSRKAYLPVWYVLVSNASDIEAVVVERPLLKPG